MFEFSRKFAYLAKVKKAFAVCLAQLVLFYFDGPTISSELLKHAAFRRNFALDQPFSTITFRGV